MTTIAQQAILEGFVLPPDTFDASLSAHGYRVVIVDDEAVTVTNANDPLGVNAITLTWYQLGVEIYSDDADPRKVYRSVRNAALCHLAEQLHEAEYREWFKKTRVVIALPDVTPSDYSGPLPRL